MPATREQKRAYAVRAYLKAKENRQCATCGAIDERTLAGSAECQSCTEKRLEKERERYRERVSSGICTRCGRALDNPGFVRCKACLERDRKTHLRLILRTKPISEMTIGQAAQYCRMMGDECAGEDCRLFDICEACIADWSLPGGEEEEDDG